MFLGAGRHGSSLVQVEVGAAVQTVDVPKEIIDALANNMPRLLQLVATYSGRTGECDFESFGHVLYILGVRYREEQVKWLFRVLDADANGCVSLGELLMLKNAIDNDITTLPARPSLDGEDEGTPEVMISIDNDRATIIERSNWGFNTLVKPVLGAIWKSELRPHHALDMMNTKGTSWQARGPRRAPLCPAPDPPAVHSSCAQRAAHP